MSRRRRLSIAEHERREEKQDEILGTLYLDEGLRALGVEIDRPSPTHVQFKHRGRPLLNYWPRTGRVHIHKARHGSGVMSVEETIELVKELCSG